MAEFLIRAQAASNPAASGVGDIIIVRPDGHVWGNAECLPEYLVVKVPTVSYKQVVKFEQSLQEQTGTDSEGNPIYTIRKRRKYRVPLATVQAWVTLGNSVVTISKVNNRKALIESVVEKTL